MRSTLRCAAPSSCCSVLSERHFPSTKNLETASRSSLAGGLPELNCVSGTSSRNSLLGNRFIFHHCSAQEFLQWASSDFCQAFWDLPRYHPPFLFVIIVSPDSFQKANPAMVRFSVTEGGMTKRHSAGVRRLLFDSRLVCGGKKHTSASRRPIGLSSGKSRVLYCGWVLRLAISTTEVTGRRNFQDSAMACKNKHPPSGRPLAAQRDATPSSRPRTDSREDSRPPPAGGAAVCHPGLHVPRPPQTSGPREWQPGGHVSRGRLGGRNNLVGAALAAAPPHFGTGQ